MATILKKVTASQKRESEWLQMNDILREEVFILESHPYFRIQIEKVWELEDDLPLFKGILAEFSQIFGNILRNAAESMKESAVKKITIGTWRDDAWIYVSIQDTGCGIDRHHMEQIFQPFFTTKTTETGLLQYRDGDRPLSLSRVDSPMRGRYQGGEHSRGGHFVCDSTSALIGRRHMHPPRGT